MIITKYENFLLENKEDVNVLIDFFGNEKEVATYLHTCQTEELCKKIFNEGFEFVVFQNTTDYVTRNEVDVVWKLNMRTSYGKYTLIIQIPTKYKDLESLSTKPIHQNENGDEVYTLPREFVKGYYNRKTSEIVKNPYFNLSYNRQKEYA